MSVFISILILTGTFGAPPPKTTESMYPDVKSYLSTRETEFDLIPPERRATLKSIADFCNDQRRRQEPVRLVFVCTHNSRRSQLAQVWMAAAASHYGLTAPWVYSGGTESTAFNPRAVAALERAGLIVQKTTADENPVYHVRFGEKGDVVTCFSKVFGHAPNPKKDFCAIMVCASADKACPAVQGATARIALAYDDPKAADDTPLESKAYDERCRQIARELLYAMSLQRGEATK